MTKYLLDHLIKDHALISLFSQMNSDQEVVSYFADSVAVLCRYFNKLVLKEHSTMGENENNLKEQNTSNNMDDNEEESVLSENDEEESIDESKKEGLKIRRSISRANQIKAIIHKNQMLPDVAGGFNKQKEKEKFDSWMKRQIRRLNKLDEDEIF